MPFWQRVFRRSEDPPPITGAPLVRRQKTYSAESGYSYRYLYLGMRRRDIGHGQAFEYVFQISSGPSPEWEAVVWLPESVLADWCGAQHRKLANNERYGIAKIALLRAFDARTPDKMRDPVILTPEELRSISDFLDLL